MQKLKPEDVLLSVATVPLLAGLVAARAIAQVMVSVGQTSEELFRGDRLPTLHVHLSHDSSV